MGGSEIWKFAYVLNGWPLAAKRKRRRCQLSHTRARHNHAISLKKFPPKILFLATCHIATFCDNTHLQNVRGYNFQQTCFVHLDIRHMTKWRMDLQESQTRSICTYIRLPWAGVVPIIAVIYTLVSIVLWQYLCRRHSSRQCALICRTFFHFLKWKVACWRDKNACCCACAYVTSPSVDRRWAHHHKSGKLPTIMLLSSQQSHIISQ